MCDNATMGHFYTYFTDFQRIKICPAIFAIFPTYFWRLKNRFR